MRPQFPILLCLIGLISGCSDPRDEKKVPKASAQASAAVNPATRPTTLPTDPAPSAAEIAFTYKRLRTITPAPVFVSNQISVLCAPAPSQTIEQARKTYGPHANTSITILMNDRAAAVFRQTRRDYPIGSIIVKQKQPHGVGGMIKRSPGYDPDHGDWEYFYFEDPLKVESGKISTCVTCHAAAKDTDYVFGSWATRR
jgi:hypothetical protein